ncbi:MAG: GntP family permease [Gammaproteobacteria bacterium]
MFDILTVLAVLAALIALAYRGISLLLLAPGLATVAVLLTGDAPVLASYTQVFMSATGGFIVRFFPVFLLGAVFGKLMEDTGSAEVLATAIVGWLGETRAVLAIVIACALMTYGGVSLFVVAFAVYPFAASLFRRAGLPAALLPATIALGAFSFTMTALPGTPAIQNTIPMPYFGTSPFAAPGLGVIAAAVMLVLGMAWINFRVSRLAAGAAMPPAPQPAAPGKALREQAAGEGFDLVEVATPERPRTLPGVWLSVLPLLLVVTLNLVFTFLVIPALDTDYLAEPRYGATSVEEVRGIWAVVGSLVIASGVLVLSNLRRLPALARTLDNGANAALVPVFNTASLVGFGAVIASLPVFAVIRDGVLGLGGDNPLVSLAVATNLLAGMTGSASGGMSIALATLGETYLALGTAHGIDPELLHRVAAVATGGLDTLPHNGAVITLLAICGLTHREAYFDLAMTALVVPLVALVVLIALGTTFGSF